MPTILIIEDDLSINSMIADALTKRSKNDYTCVQAFSGTEALLRIEQSHYDLILLDLMLPGMSGDALIKKIKPANATPIIVLTAKDDLDSKVDLLSAGAEDYITKPFEIAELLARVEVQLRRTNIPMGNSILVHKNLSLNNETYETLVDGQNINLTKQEFKILELLLTYPNKVFSKQDIYEYAWDDYYIGEDKTINVHISNIRQKLKKVSDEEYIETVWGIGFKLSK